jgi:hypothetical protein
MTAAISTQTEKDLAALMLKLSGNPKTRLHTLRMIKAIDPNYRIPADVQLEEYKAQVAREREAEKITAQAEKSRERQQGQRTQRSGSKVGCGKAAQQRLVSGQRSGDEGPRRADCGIGRHCTGGRQCAGLERMGQQGGQPATAGPDHQDD